MNAKNAAMNTQAAIALTGLTLLGGACSAPVFAQQTSPAPVADSSPLAPPFTQEGGLIDEVLTADDGGYRLRGYVVRWRDSSVYVTGSPDEILTKGESLMFTVYRSMAAGQRTLRFVTGSLELGPDLARQEAADSQASLTYGTGQVLNVLSAENGGYRFASYAVTWHDARVMVVDPAPHSLHAVGDQIRFRVLHTGVDEKRRLGFLLTDN
jgi:hypothetical protein